MAEWLKARLESLLDNLIFAGILAGGVAVWTAIEAFPIPVIIGISVGVFIIILVCIKLILKFVMKPKAITQTDHALAIPSRREALESAEVAWGLWHTGTRMKIEKLLGIKSLKRILLLEPNADNPSIKQTATKSKEKPDSIIRQIMETTDEALENEVDVRWYLMARESSITIYDPTPIDGKPCSENAWVYIEYLQAHMGLDQRRGERINNRGKGKSHFMGYYKEYEDIWNDSNKSTQAKPTLEVVTYQPDEENKLEPLELIDSFPKDNEAITTEDVKKIFLKFNKPIDRKTVGYISNYYIRKNSRCQWNICGWIQFSEDDTKLIWHVHERLLQNKDEYGPIDIDYPTFEIRIGLPTKDWKLKATDGNKLPETIIRVKIKADTGYQA